MFRRAFSIWPAAAVLSLAMGFWTPAGAATSRVWVSGLGVDTSGCGAVNAPCRTFARAYDMVAPGGEIGVRDPGEFGPLTIRKSVSIINDRVGTASVTGDGAVPAIEIVGGSGIVVLLRGLAIDGAVIIPFYPAVNITGKVALSIERCIVQNGEINFSIGEARLNVTNSVLDRSPIYFMGSVEKIMLDMTRSIVRNNEATGILVDARLSGARISVTDSLIANNGFGFSVGDNSGTSSAPIELTVTNSRIVDNSQNGVYLNNSFNFEQAVTLRLAHSVVSGNGVGIEVQDNVVVQSFGDNNFVSNGQNIEGGTLVRVTPQ